MRRNGDWILALFWLLAADLASAADARVRLDPRTPFLHVTSDLLVGNKGEESLNVSVHADCGDEVWAFDHAEIQMRRNRYGQAQFVGLPRPGCVHCDPVLIRWYHEPTGHLEFSVNVYRRKVTAECDASQANQQTLGTQGDQDA